MKVKELITLLQECDQDAIVVMSCDSEGNGHSPFYNLWTGKYRAETTSFGDVGLAELSDEDRRKGYTEEDVFEDGEPAVILTPS